MLLHDVLAIKQSLNDSEMILYLVENFIDMVDNTQYMGINYSNVYNILTELNTTIKGLYAKATDAYYQLTVDQATIEGLANDIVTFQMQAMAYLDSLEYASNASQKASNMVSATQSLLPELASVDNMFAHVTTNLELVENGTAEASASYAMLESGFAKLNMSIEALAEMLSNASSVVAALDTDSTNALVLASSNLQMVDQLMVSYYPLHLNICVTVFLSYSPQYEVMGALSKAESLVFLISNASLDVNHAFTQLDQVQSNASKLLSRPTLPTNRAEELAQNISMLSLTEQDIENILNDTLVYENATRALSEAMEALGIATTARFGMHMSAH